MEDGFPGQRKGKDERTKVQKTQSIFIVRHKLKSER